MNNLTVVFSLIIAGILAASAITILGPNITQTENDAMVQEVTNLTRAVNRFGKMLGHANLNNFSALTTNGFLDNEFYTDGVGQNMIQGNVTAATASATTTTFTYDARSPEACAYLIAHDAQYPGVFNAPACSNVGVLTAIVR